MMSQQQRETILWAPYPFFPSLQVFRNLIRCSLLVLKQIKKTAQQPQQQPNNNVVLMTKHNNFRKQKEDSINTSFEGSNAASRVVPHNDKT